MAEGFEIWVHGANSSVFVEVGGEEPLAYLHQNLDCGPNDRGNDVW